LWDATNCTETATTADDEAVRYRYSLDSRPDSRPLVLEITWH
jgi:hypothetical protein